MKNPKAVIAKLALGTRFASVEKIIKLFKAIDATTFGAVGLDTSTEAELRAGHAGVYIDLGAVEGQVTFTRMNGEYVIVAITWQS